jgi:hypothetical protein
MGKRRGLAPIVGLLLAALLASPAMAIVSGEPDEGEHPYVGELIFYVPDAVDSRFDDPGAWFFCSGTLLNSTIVLTAGHCAFGIGSEGADVWVTFSEEADFEGLPPSSTYARDENDERYDDWSAFFDSNDEWISGTAYPHPEYDDNAFFLHDLGVVVLDEPVELSDYGQLPTINYLDQFTRQNKHDTLFEAVGYGLERSRINLSEGGDTRRKAQVMLINLHSQPEATYALFSNNPGVPHKGGTCFGDSGGPVFQDLGDEEIVVAVTSWGYTYSCSGVAGAYRVDQADDLEWLQEEFGVSADNTGDPS